MKLLLILLLAACAAAAPGATSESAETIVKKSSEEVQEQNSTVSSVTKKVDDDEDDDDNDFLSKLEVLLVEVHDDALEKCVLNNDTEALKRARGADEQLEKCYDPAATVLVNSFALLESFDIASFLNLTQKFCEAYIPLNEQCTKEYHENIRTCLSDKDMKGMEIYDKMTSSAISYLCKVDTDTLMEAVENEFGCSSSQLVGLLFCVVPPLQEVVNNHNTSMAIPRALTGRGCRLYKEMAQCINNELKTCNNTTYSDIITGLINETVNAIPKCPSARTEWEEEMHLAFESFYKEEQQQSSILAKLQSQMDQLINLNIKQQSFQEKINNKQQIDSQKKDVVLNNILTILEKHTEKKVQN